jgi:hypothetical protein
MNEMVESIPIEIIILVVVVLLALIVLYYVLLVRSILDMLRHNIEQKVLLVFAFLSLIFSPFTLIMGINVLIIWSIYKKNLS